MSATNVLFAGVTALLLLLAPLEEAQAQVAPWIRTVEFVSSPRHKSAYRLGEQIRAAVKFAIGSPSSPQSATVTVTGTPQIGLTIGGQTRQAGYDAGRSTGPQGQGTGPVSVLVFTYTVQATDLDEDGISIAANALTLNGGTISRSPTIAATLSHPAVATDATVKVDGRLRPRDITNITMQGGSGGTVGFAEGIFVRVNFHPFVRISGRSRISLALTVGGQKRYADLDYARTWGREMDLSSRPYSRSGRRVSSVAFTYWVQASDLDMDGISIADEGIVLNGGSIRASASSPADLSLEAAVIDIANSNREPLKVDGSLRRNTVPKLSWLRHRGRSSSIENGISVYPLGREMFFEVGASPAVTVTGTPRLTLYSGEGTPQDYRQNPPTDAQVSRMTRYAEYHPGYSQPDRLVFSYRVQASDVDGDGLAAPDAPITLNGGSIVIRGGTTNADLSGPAGDSITLPVCGRASGGICTVDGGGSETNPGGGGTNPGGGGTNPGGGSNPEPQLRVNTVRLTGTPVSGNTYLLGEQIQAAVTFTEAVTVTGIPQIGLTIGTRTRQAIYDATQSEGTLVVFTYAVQATDSDADGISIAANALTLNGGTIRLASNSAIAASLAHTGVGTNDTRKVDGSTDGVLRISKMTVRHVARSPYPEVVGFAEGISVRVDFAEWVRISGRSRVQMALTIGEQKRYADFDYARTYGFWRNRAVNPYRAGNLILSASFTYWVQASDLDTDGISIADEGIVLNGGSIRGSWPPSSPADLSLEGVVIDIGNHNGDPLKVNGRLRRNTVPELYHLRHLGRGQPIVNQIYVYPLGREMFFEVFAYPAVTVTGTPRLTLYSGEGTPQDYRQNPPTDAQVSRMTRYAEYHPGYSQPDRLVFSYRVQASDVDGDGLAAPDAPITLNGGSIVIRGGTTNADLSGPAGDSITLPVCGRASGGICTVDGGGSETNPGGGGTNPGGGGTNPGGGSNPEPQLRVSAVRLTGTPASGATYRLGERIQAAVTFTEAVTVTGTPQLGLTIGTRTRQAVYDAIQSKGTLLVFSYYVQATDADADGISIAANALTLNGGTISLASDSATAASLAHAGVGTDDTRKVDGSTDVVEHGNSRVHATLLVLTTRTTGEVGETGDDYDFWVNVAAARSAEVAGALEQTGDADYFRVEVPGAGRLTVETRGATDTVGTLQSATGQALTEDDDGGTETNFRVERQVQAGTYYVVVMGGESGQVVGPYTLAVRFTPLGGGTTVGSMVPWPGGGTPSDGEESGAGEKSQPTPIRLNTETTGTLDQAGDVDYFRVKVQEAGMVTVEATGAATLAAFFGARNEPLLRQRAAQAGWPVTAGTYYAAVAGVSTQTQRGAYTVAVRFTAASEAGPLRATLLNVAPAQAWVHFYCGRTQDSEAAECTAQVQCGQHDGPSVAWDVEVAPETIVSYWPERRAADGTAADFAAALVAAGQTDEAAGQRTTCRVFSPDPLEVRAYTQVAGDLVPVAHPPVPLDVTAPTRVATLLNVAPAQAYVHLACRKTQTAEGEPVDPCQARLQCGQQEGMPVAWEEDVAAETTVTYGPGGTADDLATALVAAGKTEAEARRRTTCQVFSRDPLDAWAYTRVGGNLVSVANPPAPADAGAPTRVATLLNVAPAHAWVHFYCRKAHDPAAETVDPCNVRLQCGQRDGAPVAWDVEVAPETIFTYWPDKRTADGTPADFAAALIGAGKTEAEARRRTTCQVFSTDPVDVRAYTQLGGAVVPVANPPVMPATDAPTRIGTLLNLSPAHAWMHFYCRKAHRPDAETADPCNIQLQCGQQDGASVAWDVDVAPETIFSYWPGRTAADGTSDNLAAALVAAGKTEAEAQRRTTCQVFSTDPVDVRGYTQLDETVIPVKN